MNRVAQLAGVDIVEISRLRKLVDRYGEKFLDRIFTARETDYCLSKKNYAQHFAARFAVKEAVVKAASSVLKLYYRQIEVLNDAEGQPQVRLQDTEKPSDLNISVSISHAGDYAIALAVVQVEQAAG